jgi:ribosomal protein L18, bacterial type
MKLSKRDSRKRIQQRIRKRISGTDSIPRLSVFRSNKNITCQVIDDTKGITLFEVSSKTVSVEEGSKIGQAKAVGKAVAQKASEHNIERIIFDRSGYLYHGRIKALADAARENGLQF